MALPLPLLRTIATAPPADAWRAAVEHAWDVCSQPLNPGQARSEITRRDRALAPLDLLLCTGAVDLWSSFETAVGPASDALVAWWQAHPRGRAVLILDGLSLREVPWLLYGAAQHGYAAVDARAAASELPADTTSFAKALGFTQRSSLENNGASSGHRLAGARTESVDLPWAECMALIGAEPDWVLWHHWPDKRLHELAEAGHGLADVAAETASRLSDHAFWGLVGRLTTGRRLVITSDHAYAASGLFADSTEEQGKYLKQVFGSRRNSSAVTLPGPWLPPVDLVLDSRHGHTRYAVGRRKWKSQGGYPTLTHGGLSVLEVLLPFIEITPRGA